MSTGVQTAVGKFVWHENNSTDVEKAASFYTELVGWETEVWKPGEMDYPMIKAGDKTHGGFGTAEGGAPSHWLGHVLVENVDDTAERATQAGGKVVAGPFEIPEIGRMAVIADPQGAILSAYASPTEGPQSEGVFVWDELVTTDVEAAKRFYSAVFGWKPRDMDMGEMTYTIFQSKGDVDVAGALPRPEGMEAPAALAAVHLHGRRRQNGRPGEAARRPCLHGGHRRPHCRPDRRSARLRRRGFRSLQADR